MHPKEPHQRDGGQFLPTTHDPQNPVADPGRDAGDLDWQGMSTWVTLMLVLFTVLFGARRLDPTERHQGMMAALAVECVVKLAAFLAVGVFVVYGLFGGVGDLFARLPAAGSGRT